MVETTKKLVEEMNGLKKGIIKMMVDDGSFTNKDPETMIMLVKMNSILTTSMDLMVEQSELLDEMNNKLDKLLKQKVES